MPGGSEPTRMDKHAVFESPVLNTRFAYAMERIFDHDCWRIGTKHLQRRNETLSALPDPSDSVWREKLPRNLYHFASSSSLGGSFGLSSDETETRIPSSTTTSSTR
eukprot:2137918-Rhodomonas_salina.1